ncbi:MAG: prolipoprotein diacylglyceryl transferase [bacterium]
MYPKVSDLINDLFGTSINLPIQSYGLFLALAFLTGTWLLYKELDRKEKEGILIPEKKFILKGAPPTFMELLAYFAFSFVAGWKIVGFIIDYEIFVNDPQEYIFSLQGSLLGGILISLAYTGYFYLLKLKNKQDTPDKKEVNIQPRQQAMPIQLIVATFSVLYYGHRHGIRWKYLADAVSPSLIIAYGIGRIGCQLAGDGDWGIVNTAPKPGWLAFLPDWTWSYTYPHNILNEGVPIPGCEGAHCYELAEAVFPTPLYETTMAVIIFFILWSLRKRIGTPGVLFSIYLMFNGLERFLIEKIRINNVFDLFGLQVTQAEVISSVIFLTGLGLFIYCQQTKKTTIHESA